jgi:hypothetical protein
MNLDEAKTAYAEAVASIRRKYANGIDEIGVWYARKADEATALQRLIEAGTWDAKALPWLRARLEEAKYVGD